jgi:hypothetical protein
MNISNETLNILRNFSNIQSNLVIKEGNTLKTVAEAKNILAEAQISETFDDEFGIYDLNEFLGAISLVDKPTLEFSEKFVKIKSDDAFVKYYFSDTSLLTYPEKEINMPDADVEFTLTEAVLNKIRKAASTLGHTVMTVKAEGGSLSAQVGDPSNNTGNTYSYDLGECADDLECSCDFLISNLKVLPGDYKVEISSRLISKWSNVNGKLSYYIALEKSSEF